MGRVEEFLAGLTSESEWQQKVLVWPPDVFALISKLILDSGVYIQVVRDWPLAGIDGPVCLQGEIHDWHAQVVEIAEKWRAECNTDNPKKVPDKVRIWWQHVLQSDADLHEIQDDKELCHALFLLLATADEASEAAGFPDDDKDDFESLAEYYLLTERTNGSSLCSPLVNSARVRVLPKQHVPQTGITLRSLSHNLALLDIPEVRALWHTLTFSPRISSKETESQKSQHGIAPDSLRLLLVPHPHRVLPNQFRPADPPHGRLRSMPPDYGFFTYETEGSMQRRRLELDHYFSKARDFCDRIDGVIYPELSLAPDEFQTLCDYVEEKEAFLVAGVGEASRGEQEGANYISTYFPAVKGFSTTHRQDKHHRWRLDRSQVEAYELDGFLSPNKTWWEHTRVEPRNLAFFTLHPWLTFCALICEDLARQEPMARVVRAIGPNLVIALLMDGPQLAMRWPARYATVLAEDPGSSVLTFTSLGMAERSRPPGTHPSRKVALWKDARSGPREIELEPGCGALLLTLVPEYTEEWSADGRSDFKTASYPVLSGAHCLPLYPNPPEEHDSLDMSDSKRT